MTRSICPREKMFQSEASLENAAPNPPEATAPTVPEQPAAPHDATRAEKRGNCLPQLYKTMY